MGELNSANGRSWRHHSPFIDNDIGHPRRSDGPLWDTGGNGNGSFEHALGLCENRYGRWVDTLAAAPGTQWDYSDPAMAHLSLIFANIAGQEMHSYMRERIFDPIGVEDANWGVAGGGGFIGPHTCAHIGVHISARELVRFGYLMLNEGVWNDKQLIPKWWIDLATRSSQERNPEYGYTC